MGIIWTAIMAVSVLYGAATGRAEAVGAAAIEGAGAAVTLMLSIAGMICLWSGIMEVMNRAGLTDTLARLLRPVLKKLFPDTSRNREAFGALTANVSANLLGLGNAATPAGVKAAKEMLAGTRDKSASNELCRLVVMNTASIQLLPTTVAGIRAAAGAASAFDILPAVWISSVLSVTAGLAASRFLQRFFQK